MLRNGARHMSVAMQNAVYERNEKSKVIEMRDTGHFAIKFSKSDQTHGLPHAMGASGWLDRSLGERPLEERRIEQDNVHSKRLVIPVEINASLRNLKTNEPFGKTYSEEYFFGNLTQDGANKTKDFETEVLGKYKYSVRETKGTWYGYKDPQSGELSDVPTMNCIGFVLLYLERLSGKKISLEQKATPNYAWEELQEELEPIRQALIENKMIEDTGATHGSAPDGPP